MDAPDTPQLPKAFPDWTNYTLDESPWWILALKVFRRRVSPRQILTGYSNHDVETILGPPPPKPTVRDPESPESIANETYVRNKRHLQERWDLSFGPDWQPLDTRPLHDRTWLPRAKALLQSGQETTKDLFQLPQAPSSSRRANPGKPSPSELEALQADGATQVPQTFLVAVESELLGQFLAQAESFLVLARMVHQPGYNLRPVQGPPLVLHQPLIELVAATPISDPIALLTTSWTDDSGQEHHVPNSQHEWDKLMVEFQQQYGEGPRPAWTEAPEWLRLVALKQLCQEALGPFNTVHLWRPILWPSPPSNGGWTEPEEPLARL